MVQEKTTIIKILTGLLNFSSGSISSDESDDYLKCVVGRMLC